MLRFNTLFLIACLIVSADSVRAESVSFSRDIAKILLDNCQACHGAKKAAGGYRVDTFSLAVSGGDSGTGFAAGDLDDSEAFRRMITDDISERMPLDRERLTDKQVSLLRDWIGAGAKFDGVDPESSIASIVVTAPQPTAPSKYRLPVPITSLKFNADGNELLVGGYHEITVWSSETGELVRRIPNIGQRTMGMDITADGKTLLVAGGVPGKLGAIRCVDLGTGAVSKVFGACGDLIHDVKLSPDGKRIAAVSAESILQIYDSDGTNQQLSLASHSDWVTAVCWSPDGSKIVTASRDKTCKVIDAESGELLISYAGHGKSVKDVIFHSNGVDVFSAGTDNKVHRWKIDDAKKIAEWTFADEVYRITRSEQTLFATSADKTVRQFDSATNKETGRFREHANRVISLDHHAEQNRLATGGIDGEICIWDTTDGRLVTSFYAAPGFKMASVQAASQ